ncbi:MAG TPA: signal peptidase II [Spirochaetia bacterium]|nr:signal peptidase II [Spirochaetia bacterium]
MTKDRVKILFIPFILTLGVILVDQVSKAIISFTLRVGDKIEVLGDFFWLWHVRNTGMAFSMGSNLPPQLRGIFFLALPVIVLLFLMVYYFRMADLTGIQRWCFAAILGGGLGNLIDRFLRPDGVVDFVSIKFYGLFGIERYPTFNFADSTVVVAGIIVIILYIVCHKRSAE